MCSYDDRGIYFDKQASIWKHNYPPDVLNRAYEILCSLGIKKGERILDLGCGSGVLFPTFDELTGDMGTVSGLDFSLEMLKAVHDESVKAVRICAEASNIPIADSSFDRVIAFASFPHFIDKKSVCTETNRVLKPGGQFHVIHLSSSKQLRLHHKNTGGVVENDILPSKEEFSEMLYNAGFTEIKIMDVSGKYLMRALKP